MSNIIYKPYVFTYKITGSTNTYTLTSPQIDVDIDINKSSTFNLAYFDRNFITKYDIIYSLIDYIDVNIDKFFLNVLIVDTNNIFDDIVLPGLYCVKFYYNDTVDYILINVINERLIYESVLLYQDFELINDKLTTTTTTIVIKTPLIYYNYSYDDKWKGGELTVPYDVSLQLYHNNYTGWTSNELIDLFIDNIYDYYNQNVSIYDVNINIYKSGSLIIQNEILYSGKYYIVFSYVDTFGNKIVNTISDIYVIDELSILFYNNILNDNISGTTNTYSGVTHQIDSDVIINSGFTFNLNAFDNNIITKYDIITSLINYINNDIDKYLLNVLIVDSNNIYEQITEIGTYCIKIYYNNFVFYLLMKSINDVTKSDIIYYEDINLINTEYSQTTTTTTIKSPVIYYNYSTTNIWSGGGMKIPYNIFIHLINNENTGWTINQLRDLFIDYVYDNYEQLVDINKVNVKLYKQNSSILENSISSVGVYRIIFSYFDMFDNYVVNTINNINVVQNTPIIYFKDYILSSHLSGNTNDYTGVTSNYIPDITVDSGFIFNLNGFSNNEITKNDIIHYLIEYVRGDNDEIIDKYSVNITIAKPTIYKLQNVYESIFNPGIFCIQVLKENIFGDKTIKYFIMKVVSNSSVYSDGFWQDNKVWVDSVVWLDHPIVGA